MHLRNIRRRFAAVLSERTRLAREMHDTLIQGCVGVATLLEAASQAKDISPKLNSDLVDRARNEVRGTIDEARLAIWNLRHAPEPWSDPDPEPDPPHGARGRGERHPDRVPVERHPCSAAGRGRAQPDPRGARSHAERDPTRTARLASTPASTSHRAASRSRSRTTAAASTRRQPHGRCPPLRSDRHARARRATRRGVRARERARPGHAAARRALLLR